MWYRFSGRQMGYVGNNGTIDADYAASIANRIAAQGTGAFANGASTSTSFADFDLAHDHLNSYAQGSAGGMYVVQSGDTLSGIAAALWGDASLWYKIAEVNGLTAESALIEGLPLIVPAGVQRNENNAETFKPYDPLEVLGSTAPTAVAPRPKKKNCGVLGQLVVQVLAFVIAMAINHVLPGLGRTVVGRAFTQAAANAGAQYVAVQAGIQEKFSWNAVGMAAVGSLVQDSPIGDTIADKIANKIGGGNFVRNFVEGAVDDAVTQGVGRATGMQKEFSWASVAASGLSNAYLKKYVGKVTTAGKFAHAFAARTLIAATMRSLIEGDDFDDAMVGAMPGAFTSTLGIYFHDSAEAMEALVVDPVVQAEFNLEDSFGVKTLTGNDRAALTAQGYLVRESAVGIDATGRAYFEAAPHNNVDGAWEAMGGVEGLVLYDGDGAAAYDRSYTLYAVAREGERARTFIARDGGVASELFLGARDNVYGVTVARYEPSAEWRAQAHAVGQQVRAARDQRAYEATQPLWQAELRYQRAQSEEFTRQALVAIGHITPVVGTYFAYQEFRKNPNGWNAAALGLSLFGDGAMAVSALRGAAMFRGAGAADDVVVAGSRAGAGPWVGEATDIVDGGAFVQCADGSCVSAAGQLVTGGRVTETQLLDRLGEWADPRDLLTALNSIDGAGAWEGGLFSSAEDALRMVNRGPAVAVLQAPRAPAHAVMIEPLTGAAGQYRVYDTGIGATYRVDSAWVERWVSGGVYRR